MLDLEPIKERLAAATPGPWFADDDGGVSTEPHAYTMTSTPVVDTEGCGMGNPKDAIFIANAPEDIAALVAEVEQLRELPSVQHCWKNDGTAYCGDTNAKPFFPASVEESNAVPACSICHKRVCHSQADENATLQAQIEADSDVMFAQREEMEHLRAQIDAVRALHVPVDVKLYAATVKECVLCPEQWPCETIRTLEVGDSRD